MSWYYYAQLFCIAAMSGTGLFVLFLAWENFREWLHRRSLRKLRERYVGDGDE